MRVVTAVLTSRLRRLPAYLLATGLLVTGFSMDPARASGIQGRGAVEILEEFRDSDDQISSLFEGAGIHADMGGRASIFAQRDGVRYALVIFPIRGSIRAERIGKPYCRGRLLTPERARYETELSQKVSDRLVSVHLFKNWRSRGQIGSAEVRTQNLAGAGHAVSLCRAPEDEVKSAPTVIREADITAARIAVADASFQTEDFATAARRYRDLYEDTNDAAILVKEVISMLQAGDLDAGFERDEVLQNRLEEVADADLLERYEDAMSRAVNAYLSAAP